MNARVIKLHLELARIHAELAKEMGRDEEPSPDPNRWVPHSEWPVASRRVACELARDGKIKARRVGKLWIARQKDLDAYLEAHPTARAKASPDEIEALAAAAEAAGRRRRRKVA